MAKHWKDVKEAIEADIDRIFWEEPEEVKMCRLGIFPSGAGVDGQYFGAMLFMVADTQAMGWWTIGPAMGQAFNDPEFSVTHLKRMWQYLTAHMADLMGAKAEPECPAPWLNLPKLYQFSKDIIESFDSIETKEELADLLWSWDNYVNRLNSWFFLVFPWHLGDSCRAMTPEKINELISVNKAAGMM